MYNGGGYNPAESAAAAAAASGASAPAGPSVDIWGTGSQGQLPVVTGGGNTVHEPDLNTESSGGLDFQHGMGAPATRTYTAPYTDSSINGLLADLYTMSKQDIIDLQSKMVRAGLLDSKSIRWGQPDDATYSAYARFLQRAQRQQAAESASGQQVSSITDILDAAAAPATDQYGNPLPGGGSSGQQNQVLSVTDPTALRETVQQAAQDIIGRTLSADQANEFVSRITNAEVQSQKVTNGIDAQVDPSAEAQAYVKMLYPNIAKANNAVNLFNVAMQTFGINGG